MAGKRPRDRKATIVTTAAALFAERGYDAVGMDDIGAALGIRGPSIYHHFPNKEALLQAVFMHLSRQLATLDPQEIDPDGLNPETMVGRLVETVLDNRDGLVTSITEGYRLDFAAVAEMGELALLLRDRGHAMITALCPEIDPRLVELRLQAFNGSLGAAAYESGEVPRPRLDELLTRSALALFRAPERTPPDDPGADSDHDRDPGGWRPRRSRREQIVVAAGPLFRSRSFLDVSVNDIGEAAGLSGPTVYHYFESKIHIWLAAAEQSAVAALVGAREALTSASSAGDALERLARSWTGLALDRSRLIAVPFHYRLIPGPHKVAPPPHLAETAGAWVAVVGELRPDLDNAEAEFLAGVVFQLMLHASDAVQGAAAWQDEIAGLVVAFLTA